MRKGPLFLRIAAGAALAALAAIMLRSGAPGGNHRSRPPPRGRTALRQGARLPDGSLAGARPWAGGPGRASPHPAGRAALFDAILDAARSGDAALWSRVSNTDLRILVALDPISASGLALGLDRGPVREEALRRVSQAWACGDPNAALGWAAALADAVERTNALSDVCLQLSQSDPAQAAAIATQFGLANAGGCIENIVQQWADQDVSAAHAWVSQLPAGAARDAMMARLASVVAQVSPAEAADLVANEIDPGPVQCDATICVLRQWGLQDFAAASAWAERFPEGPLADRARRELSGILDPRAGAGR